MATYIQDTLDQIDVAIGTYAQTVFSAMGGPISTMLQVAGVVGLVFVGLNTALGIVPIRMSEYVKWTLRYIIVTAVATSWAQFLPIYNIITNVPQNVAAELLGVTGAPTLNIALDQMVTNLFDLGDLTSATAGTFDFGMAGIAILLMVMGALMACIAIIVSAVAKIGLAMAVSLGPIFIASLLFRGTSDLFTNWSRFTLGFALIPLILAGVMGAVLRVGQTLITAPTAVTSISTVAGFLIVVLAAIIMMSQVPTMVNGLAGSIVATASGVREARMVADVATGGATAAARMANPRVQQALSAADAARSTNGSVRDKMNAALADGRQTNAAMKANRERFDKRSSTMGQRPSRAELREASRAGLRRAALDNMAERGTERKPPRANRLADAGPSTRHTGHVSRKSGA